ncbi:hypothetical protein [Streptomyces sp. NPDC001282]|uniref:hypothetical protein n=1 Tax=Streptomyces sp. NPDC001282 TaxID=3364557 RepID=UPI0036892D00
MEIYAMSLTDGPAREVQRIRHQFLGFLSNTAVFAVLLILTLADSDSGGVAPWVRAVLFVCSGALTVIFLRTMRAR